MKKETIELVDPQPYAGTCMICKERQGVMQDGTDWLCRDCQIKAYRKCILVLKRRLNQAFKDRRIEKKMIKPEWDVISAVIP